MGNFVRSIISFIVFQCMEDSYEGPTGRESSEAGSRKAGQGNEVVEFSSLDNQPARTGLQRRA